MSKLANQAIVQEGGHAFVFFVRAGNGGPEGHSLALFASYCSVLELRQLVTFDLYAMGVVLIRCAICTYALALCRC